MPKSSNVDQCVTVRLPHGIRDELVAATGQPFSRIVRFMVMALLERKRAERAAAIAAGTARSGDARKDLQEDISQLPQLPAEGADNA